MAKQSAAARPMASSMRFNEEQYKSIALAMREKKLQPTASQIAAQATFVLRKEVPVHEITTARMNRIKELMLAQDAAEAERSKTLLAASVGGLKNANVADLAMKSIVNSALDAKLTPMEHRMLEGMRKLLLSQEARLRQVINQQRDVIACICTELSIPMPVLAEPDILPTVELDGRVTKPPRVLIYGMHTNQRQMVTEKIREWGAEDVATVDLTDSRESVSHVKKNYDVVIVNRHVVGVDTVRDLANHGQDLITANGTGDVMKHLQSTLLGFKIEKKRSEV